MPASNTPQGLSNPELWSAIKAATLPGNGNPGEGRNWNVFEPFQGRLSARYNLTAESARRLEEEYRRYLYLKTIDGGVLTPSKRVDQAWHLHIETPGGVWGRYCDEVLGTQLVHHTGVSPSEAEASSARLFDLYRREFGDEPPVDIWPGKRERQVNAIGVTSIVLGGVLIVGGGLMGTYMQADDSWVGQLVVGGIGLFILGAWLCKGTDLEADVQCG